MPTYLAEGSKCSATALLAALRLAVSKSDIFVEVVGGWGVRRGGEEEEVEEQEQEEEDEEDEEDEDKDKDKKIAKAGLVWREGRATTAEHLPLPLRVNKLTISARQIMQTPMASRLPCASLLTGSGRV